MAKRTPAEIARQIEGLKAERKSLPEKNFFGSSNWDRIDAQLSVLEGKRTPDSYYMDEQVEDYEDGDNDIYFAASEAEDWMNGHSTSDLFDSE